jgi:hypothetical protein
MTVAMLTPLFPPDTSNSARYAKLLAAQLHNLPVTVVAYGKLPESVSGIHIISISKSGSKLSTIYNCFQALRSIQPTSLLVHNGPSSDLPALLYSIFHPATNIIYIESDLQAIELHKNPLMRFIQRHIKNRAQATLTLPPDSLLYLPAEKLPFVQPDLEQESNLKKWWTDHSKEILSYVS